MSWMFKLRGNYNTQQGLIFGFIGFLITLFIWFLVTMGENPMIESGILPKPSRIIPAFKSLYQENELIKNLCLSLGFNFGGYFKAVLLSIPIGFAIGLYPVFNSMFQGQINAYRFIPLTAVTSIFIASFGIGTGLKMNFLAFGIMIYLIPIIIQRIKEVEDVYTKTVYTLGATDWQTIKTVFLPSVLSKLSDDIRVLTAISWTYIIVAEGIGDQGGLGSLVYRAGQRMGRPDKTFAILILFILIGLVQDRLFVYLDKKFFPHKYQIKDQHSNSLQEESIFETILDYVVASTIWLLLAIYLLLAINEFFPLFGNIKPLGYLFEDTVWVVHLIFLSIIAYKGWNLFNKRPIATKTPAAV